MRHLFSLLPFLLLFLPVSAQHRPDSVIWNGEWHYIYPVPEQLKASQTMLQRMDLIEEEFELYRVWYKKNDPRKGLKGKALHKALKKELVASKRMTEEDYNRSRRRFNKIFSPRYRGCVRSRGVRLPKKRKKTMRIKRFVAVSPGILVTDELRVDNDLVPYIGELPDGKYIQYFDLFFTFDKHQKMQPLSPKVACVFTLSDNHPEGNYMRFAYNGDTLRSGSFTDGKREGTWKITHEYGNNLLYTYAYFRFNKVTRRHEWLEVGFRNGIPNGDFRSYEAGRLLHTGQLTNGKMSGTWDMKQWGWDLFSDRIRFEIGNDADSADWPENRLVFFRPIPTADGNGFRFSGTEIPSMEYGRDFMYGLASYNQTIRWEHSLGELDIVPYDIYRDQRYSQGYEKLYEKATYRSLTGSWHNGKTAFRYRFDPESRGVLGASFYENGQLFDTIGYDQTRQEFFHRAYDLDGKLYYEQLSDHLGEEISETFFNEKQGEVVWIDGLPAIASSDDHCVWENPERTLIGNRQYVQKLWYRRSRRLCNDIYMDTVAGVYVYTAYNGLEEPYYQKTTKLAAHFHESEVLPEGDSLIRSESTWGRMKVRSVLSHTGGKDLRDRKFLFDDQPYTGSFTMNLLAGKCAYALTNEGLRIDFKWKELEKAEHRRSTKREDRSAGLAMHDNEVIASDWMEVMENFAHHRVDMDEVCSYSGRFEAGKPAGEWIFYGKNKKELFRLQYNDELPSGTVRNFAKLRVPKKSTAGKSKYHYRFGPPVYEWKYSAELVEYELKNGELDGRYTRYWKSGDTMELLNYRDGELHGKQEVRTERQRITGTYDNGKRTGEFLMVNWEYAYPKISGKEWHIDTICRFQYENGLLNGTAFLKPERYSTEQPYISASYRDNLPEGKMTVYDNETREPVEKLFFENGLLLRREFYSHGELSYFLEFPASDSIRIVSQLISKKSSEVNLINRDNQHHGYIGESENISERNFLEQRKHSTLTRLYPNGKVARKGPLLLDTKTGHWEFFNYAGQQLYSIDYLFPGNRNVPGTQTDLIGSYTEYDTLGNVLSKRAVIEETEKYNCSHDEYYAIRQYITLEDPDDGIERTNGTIRNYFDNGMLMSEGQLVDGVPTGVWKFYTPDGKLHIVGRYEKGVKEGRWLTGDLTDKKYIGDLCLDPDDPLLDFHVAEMERELAISVALFKGGKLQVKQEYDIHRND